MARHQEICHGRQETGAGMSGVMLGMILLSMTGTNIPHNRHDRHDPHGRHGARLRDLLPKQRESQDLKTPATVEV